MPPIYDYQCRNCNHEYEVFYKTQAAVKEEEKKETCPVCASVKKKKLVSKNTGIDLKGRWFKQGY